MMSEVEVRLALVGGERLAAGYVGALEMVLGVPRT